MFLSLEGSPQLSVVVSGCAVGSHTCPILVTEGDPPSGYPAREEAQLKSIAEQVHWARDQVVDIVV